MASKKKAKTKAAGKKRAPSKKPATKKSSKKKAPAKKPAKKALKKKASPGKPAAKKSATKQTAKPSAKKAAPPRPSVKTAAKPAKKPLQRRDATGHLNAEYEHDLRRAGREKDANPDDRAFLVGKNADDALANELGREYVETVNSGEDEGIELRDEFVTEEVGGPFVPSTRGKEIDEQPDESNPRGATREPFPKTSS